MNSGIAFLVDFGSTFTKLTAVDLDEARLLGRTQAPSSVDSDIMIGFQQARSLMDEQFGRFEPTLIRACSSAAGGLRMIAIGLVPNLTVKAAQHAALGAGAKLIRSYAYGLTASDVREIEEIAPDMLLLTGGTNGGNWDVIVHNAANLAQSSLTVPIVVAGNKNAVDDIMGYLEAAGKYAVTAENVMPEFGRLNVDPTRSQIRDLFMQRIVHAKGLDGAREVVGDVVMPTPMAVLEAARLIADGAGGQGGMGDLILVDVGGATTDVHSIATGDPSSPSVMLRGLPEPRVKRTVEGDLGVRVNAPSVLEIAQQHRMASFAGSQPLEERVAFLSQHTDALPEDGSQAEIDIWLARTAVEVASIRHAGEFEVMYTPTGQFMLQSGKDLRPVETVIGTGGVLAYSGQAAEVLAGVRFSDEQPLSLRPQAPSFYLDRHYILYAIGLLGQESPEVAVNLARSALEAL